MMLKRKKKQKKMSKTFGILAFPAAHSLSPAMHNFVFRKLGIDAEYKFFEIPAEKLAEFMWRVRDEKIAGLSVSIPHKIEVMKYLDEIEDSAKKIGAVNTIFWREEKLAGTNTDWLGFSKALEMKISADKKRVVVLGGGGAARAIVYALLRHNCQISVITREAWEFEGLKKDFGDRIENFDFIENLENYDPDILVNSTPLGMKGKFEEMSFIDPKWFEKHQPLVFDIVYNPLETQLLKDAKKAGCEAIGGWRMFFYQAISQLKIWFPEKRDEIDEISKDVKLQKQALKILAN